MENRNICFFDLETTSIDTETTRIVQIAFCITDRDLNVISGPFKTLINPETEIPAESTAVHGIKNEDVVDAPKFVNVAQSFYNSILGCDLAGFNAKKFDIPVLINEFYRCGIEFSIKGLEIIDPYIFYAKKEKRDLAAALKFYCGKEMVNAHDAEADIMATVEIARGQLTKYDDVTTLKDLIAVTEPENTCDLAGKIVMKDGVPIFNFGPHYGKPISENMGFLTWMQTKDFPKQTKDWIDDYLANLT